MFCSTVRHRKLYLGSLGDPNQVAILLVHRSRRIGELIGYSWYGIRPSSVRPQCSKIFFSKTAWPIKAKFYVEPPWVGGTKICSRHLGQMTKMASTPIKNPFKIFSRNGWPIFTKLGIYWGPQPIIVCSNDDPGVKGAHWPSG